MNLVRLKHGLSRVLVTEPAVRLGLFRRLKPLSRKFGSPRGKPIDRHFIEDFLARHQDDIAGRVLEAGDDPLYARRFGGERVARLDVMYPMPGMRGQTLVADLTTGEGLEESAYDCLLLTQVYNFIYDVRSAVETSWRALKPRGVLLATMEALGQLALDDRRLYGVYWRFTDQSAARLFGEVFGAENVEVEAYGNVFAACAFLQCLAAEDLTERELSHRDPEYQITIALRAVKRPIGGGAPGAPRTRAAAPLELTGHTQYGTA